ncbi:MAG TPA: DUF362 domain-containing protein [Sphaerochaetaceae bacterium]|nr:DUF362 domain-containing protein [Sphaerochaetaceae bacterium]
MTRRLLERIPLETMVQLDAAIVLKPNLVVPSDASEGATTHPEIVEAVISYLVEHGYRNLTIAESAWVGASTSAAFKAHGYHDLSKRYNVKLVDIKKDKYIPVTNHGYTVEMSQTIMQADFLISLPVLKGHCQTTMTCALKNMKGCISDTSKRKFHSWGLHEPIAVLNTIKHADLVIVDSLNGDLDFEEGGNPVQTNRMFAGLDSVLIDTFGTHLMGFDVSDVPYISLAESLHVGSGRIEQAAIVELNSDSQGETARPTGRVQTMSTYTLPSSACSACFGNLIHALARMEDRGSLSRLDRKVHIGQDYRGKSGCGLGVGVCTSGFTHSLAGCPPKAVDMVHFLEHLIEEN